MKTRLLSLLCFAGLAPILFGQIRSAADFIAAYRAAMDGKDAGRLQQMTYTNGISAEDLKLLEQTTKMCCLMNKKIARLSLEPLPDDFTSL